MEEQFYNLDSLEKVTGGDKEFMSNMVKIFLNNTPDDLSSINEALERRDYSFISSVAHKMKPSIDYMCVDRLLDDAKEIEEWSKGDDEMIEKTHQFVSNMSTVISQLGQQQEDLF